MQAGLILYATERKRMLLFLVVIMFFIHTGFAGSGNEKEHFANSCNSIGYFLFRELFTTTENVVLSPLSVGMALGIMALSVDKYQADETRKALDFPLTDGRLMQEVRNVAGYGDVSDEECGLTVDVSNALFAKSEFTTDYKKKVAGPLEIHLITFKDANDVNEQMYKWVSDNTKGFINPPFNVARPDVEIVIVNTVYFKGEWLSPFDKKGTEEKPFYKSDGSAISVPAMHAVKSLHYYKDSLCEAVELPYKCGGFSMVVILPGRKVRIDTFDIAGVITKINSEISGTGKRDVNLSIPLFEINFVKDVKDILKKRYRLPEKYTFARIVVDPVLCQLNKILHCVRIINDETGTEAAAATYIEFGFISNITITKFPIDFFVDRPFFFFIKDNTASAIWFMGSVVNPLQLNAGN